MDLWLDTQTAMVLGPGNALDRAIVRALASEGAATLATTAGEDASDLAQHGDDQPHWTSIEPHINATVAGRLRRFLEEQNRSVDAVVLHVDVLNTLQARGPLRWWRYRRDRERVLQEVADAAATAASQQRHCQIVLVYQLSEDSERDAALRWLDRATLAALDQAHADGAPVRVNAVLLGTESNLSEAADLVAVLSSPIARGVSGALIPIDDGTLAADYLSLNRKAATRRQPDRD